MEQQKHTTHDLGNGWYANLWHADANYEERLTIRNPDKGKRIDLAAASLQKLRQIFAQAEAASQKAA